MGCFYKGMSEWILRLFIFFISSFFELRWKSTRDEGTDSSFSHSVLEASHHFLQCSFRIIYLLIENTHWPSCGLLGIYLLLCLKVDNVEKPYIQSILVRHESVEHQGVGEARISQPSGIGGFWSLIWSPKDQRSLASSLLSASIRRTWPPRPCIRGSKPGLIFDLNSLVLFSTKNEGQERFGVPRLPYTWMVCLREATNSAAIVFCTFRTCLSMPFSAGNFALPEIVQHLKINSLNLWWIFIDPFHVRFTICITVNKSEFDGWKRLLDYQQISFIALSSSDTRWLFTTFQWIKALALLLL